MERKNCETCGRVIPAGRILALPETKTCLWCSKVTARTEADIDVDGADSGDLVRSMQSQSRNDGRR